MDKIELVVMRQAGGPVDRHWSATFGMAGGTLGRAGQNKLVLPDDDAMVARVHAMVRLDSDQAYIANLCERRSVRVDGLEVLSGQEVPLAPGASIWIGPYELRAVVPGQQSDAPIAKALPTRPVTDATPWNALLADAGAVPSASTPGATTASSALDLASLPNPWADIAPIVEGGAHIPGILRSSRLDAPPQPVATDVSADANPFAMLGRVEAIPTMASIDEPSTAGPRPEELPATASPAAAALVTDVLPAVSPAEHAPPHPFEISAATSKHAPTQPTAHRAMVIPDDFNPFAADPKEQARQRDPWSGDLAAKSLTEVAQLRNDDLLQALPRTGQFAGEMDNASHTGLPKQLDPAIELNPLKLFREPGESMYAEPEDHGMSRGSDLAQVFNMPRDTQQRRAAALPDTAASTIQPAARLETHADPAPLLPTEPAVQAGLHAMQGLDLELFGCDETMQVSSSADLLDITVIQAPQEGTASLSKSAPQPTQAPIHPPAAPCIPVHAQATAASLEALAAAFLEGAAIEPGKASITITPDFMRAFGEALRVAVQGSIDLLSARSEIKREFRADVTIIASGANNPLKFLPTADGVMLQLAGETFPGFMKPVPAMKEAYKDLAVHQIALMAGIRAAYAEAVAQLSPAELAKDATAASGFLEKISSVHRKAALWEDFQQRYESVRRHAEDDLMAFSGKTFVDAYEAAAQSAEGLL